MYIVPGLSPVSVNEVAGFAASVTRIPADADSGAVAPTARRIITPVKDAAVGLVHYKAIEVVAGVAVTPVTAPGMAKVVEVTVAAAA